jgi:hypothetical protein
MPETKLPRRNPQPQPAPRTPDETTAEEEAVDFSRTSVRIAIHKAAAALHDLDDDTEEAADAEAEQDALLPPWAKRARGD